MKGTVKYSEEFITATGLKRWIGIELEFDQSSKDGLEMLSKAEDIVKSYAGVQYQDYGFGQIKEFQAKEIVMDDRRIGIMAMDIMSCEDLKTLESYQLLIKGKPELQEAYALRHAELTQKQ
jgi:hypothetical protein